MRILLALLLLTGCSVAAVDHPIAQDEAAYAATYPAYAEICALSGIDKKPGFGAEVIGGGPGGHSTMFLNAICRDDSAGYPVVKLCDASTPPDMRGVGISVNDHFQNAKWVATPGREFFYRGTLPDGAPLTKQSYAATQAQAQRRHIYDGVVFHDEFMRDRPADWSIADWQYELSVGSDYATDLARDRYCARVPLSVDQMREIVTYLNDENAPYRSGRKIFHWDVARNNCTHLIHNALAAAGVWPPWEANRFLALAVFDFPVPANDLVNLLERIDATDLRDLDALYADKFLRRAFLAEDWLPPQPGVLVEAHHQSAPNEVYGADHRLIFFDQPWLGSYERSFDRFFSSPRSTDMRSNLEYYDALYKTIELERKPAEEWQTYATNKAADFRVFYERYYHYIEARRRLVEAALAGYR